MSVVHQEQKRKLQPQEVSWMDGWTYFRVGQETLLFVSCFPLTVDAGFNHVL